MVFKNSPRKSPILVLRLSAQGGDLNFNLLLFNAIPRAGAWGWGRSPLLRASPPGRGWSGDGSLPCSAESRGWGARGKHRSLVPLLGRGEKSLLVFVFLME